MNEKYELYKHIYKDAEMACFTLEKLREDLKEKDNKIKSLIDEILSDYKEWKVKIKKILESNNETLPEAGSFEKMMAKMGIAKEVKDDNSDTSIADMLIQGVSMGSIDTEKKIKNYKNKVDKDQIKICKYFLEFQQETIEKLKKYL